MTKKHPVNWLLVAFLGVLGACFIWAEQTSAANDFFNPENIEASVNGSPSLSMKDCSNTGVGMEPLMDLGRRGYHGFSGGLYMRGNQAPDSHYQMGMAASDGIELLNQQGQPDSSGKIVLLSVGMSNVKQEFSKFIRLARNQTAPGVALVNGAQPGYDATRIADPNSEYWVKVDAMLQTRDLSPLQVQAIWLKEAVALEDDAFPQNAQELQDYLRTVVLIAEDRYPNLKAIYFSSRIYGGYAEPNGASPEPWAYEGGFAVKWLIEAQMQNTDLDLAYDNTPWLGWGPYLWADGMNPRSDGLIWRCDDFEDDGVHPSESGEIKVAMMLLQFFKNDPMTQWFPNS